MSKTITFTIELDDTDLPLSKIAKDLKAVAGRIAFYSVDDFEGREHHLFAADGHVEAVVTIVETAEVA